MATLQFWIEFGSTYTYLAVARTGRLAKERGVTVEWQPFYLYPIFVEQGMNQGPFIPYPNKMAYMWRDIERSAQRHGIPYRRPSTYPVNSIQTARIAVLAQQQGWCQAFTEKVFDLHWTQDYPIGTAENLQRALTSIGKDPLATITQAESPAIKDALRAQTERAKALKIFGAPSFTYGDELFWGADRLEEAIDWAATHRQAF